MSEIRFIGDFNLSKNTLKITDETIYHHGVDVLRLKQGDTFIIGDGLGKEADAQVVDLDNRSMTIAVDNVRDNKHESSRDVTLYCSIVKRGNFEEICRQATQVGVSRIVPLISERTVKTGLRRDRLEKIIREAAEQSQRGILPVLSDTVTFEEALGLSSGSDITLMPHTDAVSHIRDISLKEMNSISLFIGPEGGWADVEIVNAKENGAQIVSLGKSTLKTETAAVVAAYYTVNV